MNDTMIKNILTPIVGFIVAWLARKFPLFDAETWNTFVSGITFGAVALVLGFFNRTSSLMNTVGNQPGTTVVTTPANAAALPANKDVIAATPQITTAVNAAKP